MEGDASSRVLELTVTLSAPRDEPVAVDFQTTDGTATSTP
jgi:hypothetical protein